MPAHTHFAGAPDRWRLCRFGVVNAWQYANETIELHNSRVVLFGVNGSGKTMLLEFILPFLLDADGAPSRLSTSGGNDRGGLWERAVGIDGERARPGYLWCEFVRTIGGDDQHFTIGTRLAAKPKGKGGDHTWFVTSKRPGRDLHLLDPHRVPAQVDDLERQIGDTGTVFRNARNRYRDTVRETLYPELSAGQFAQLLETLLLVRRKNVAERLNPTYLNTLLTEGLPPLDPTEIGSVAAGFEELDRRHDQIERLEADRAIASRLAGAVKAYARQVLARVTKTATDAQTARDNARRRRIKAEEATERIEGELEETNGRITSLEGEQSDLDGRLEGLRRSEAHQAGQLLEDAARRRDETAGAATKARERATKAAGKAKTARATAEGSAAEAEAAAASVRDTARDARDLAADTAALAALTADTDDDQLPTMLRPAVTAHRANLKQVVGLVDDVAHHQAKVEGYGDRIDETEGRIVDQQGKVTAAATAVADTTTSWREAAGRWLVGLAVLDPATLDGLAAAEPSSAADTVAAHHLDRVRRLDADRARHTTAVDAAEQETAELTTRRAELEAGADPQPEPPGWRTARDDRPGLPLWRALDPHDEHDGRLPGVEAAMLAAGILDAWVTPEGHIDLTGDLADVFAAVGPHHDGTTLADVLRPADDAPPHLSAWLASVPLGPSDTPVWVATDGRFRTGPVAGRATPADAARHLGASARAAARAAEIATIDRRLAELDETLTTARAAIAAADADETAANHEKAALPTTADIDTATRELGTAEALLASHEGELTRLQGDQQQAEEDLADATRELRRVAAGFGLPTAKDALNAEADLLDSLDTTLNRLDGELDKAARAARDAARDADTADDAETDADAEEAEANEKADAARRAKSEHDTLEANVGADVAEVHRLIDEAKARMRTVTSALKTSRDKHAELREQLGTAKSEQATADERYGQADAARDAAHDVLLAAVRDGLAAEADVTIDTALDSVADRRAAIASIARQTGETFEPRTLSARQATVARHTTDLAANAHASFDTSDNGDWMLLTVRVDGRTFSARQLNEHLTGELDRARHEITEKEAELFERTLTGSVRRHLATRIRTAEQHKDRMNELMRGVRTTAGGVTAQLKWSVDGDVDDAAVLRRARELLLSDLADPAEREELHNFLRRQIERARAAEAETVSWQERLEAALDYRHWHRFDLLIEHDRHTDGPVRITSRKLGLSTGEATVALTLPLIAAVVAYYLPDGPDTPRRTSPRLLLMDELFPTLDPENKRLFMRLLNDLDLDAVFTSDKDQCHYDTVDGIAIHHIHKDESGWAVSTRSEWNGREVIDAPVTEPAGQAALGLAGV